MGIVFHFLPLTVRTFKFAATVIAEIDTFSGCILDCTMMDTQIVKHPIATPEPGGIRGRVRLGHDAGESRTVYVNAEHFYVARTAGNKNARIDCSIIRRWMESDSRTVVPVPVQYDIAHVVTEGDGAERHPRPVENTFFIVRDDQGVLIHKVRRTILR